MCLPQYKSRGDDYDFKYEPDSCLTYELMINDYAMDFGLDPLIVETRDIKDLYFHWASKNNRQAAQADRLDHDKNSIK